MTNVTFVDGQILTAAELNTLEAQIIALQTAGATPTIPSFEQLSDVQITSPNNGDVPTYNSTLEKWVNLPVASGSGSGGSSLPPFATGYVNFTFLSQNAAGSLSPLPLVMSRGFGGDADTSLVIPTTGWYQLTYNGSFGGSGFPDSMGLVFQYNGNQLFSGSIYFANPFSISQAVQCNQGDPVAMSVFLTFTSADANLQAVPNGNFTLTYLGT